MTGDWIKWTKGLTRKPEVVAIADRLSISNREAAALLMEVWEWTDQVTPDGFINGVKPSTLDSMMNFKGLSKAMIAVGWLIETGDGLAFPHFEWHNGNSAKKRALTARRVQNHRERALQM